MKQIRKYPKRFVYEVGKRFHNFIIVAESPTIRSKCGRTYTNWLCKCDCGNQFFCTTKAIRKGFRKSCGCLSKSHYFRKVTDKEFAITAKYNHYKQSAKVRDIEFVLTKDNVGEIIFRDCSYCGYKPSMVVKNRNHFALANGIDRVDSESSYCVENCVPCCKICNLAKGAVTLEEFRNWIERLRIYENTRVK